MIPKIIHYCWVGDKKFPASVERYIASWKTLLPDYKFMLWDKEGSNIDAIPWTREAFAKKKYAFVADYIRCYALYHYGGIYLDTDVEVLKSFDPFLNNKYMIGKENSGSIEAAIIGAEPRSLLFGKMLDYYKTRHFDCGNGLLDMRAVPLILDEVIRKNFKVKQISSPSEYDKNDDAISLLTDDFFSPKSCHDGKIYLTSNTVCIHHYSQSWQSPIRKYGRKLVLKIGGPKLKDLIKSIIYGRTLE